MPCGSWKVSWLIKAILICAGGEAGLREFVFILEEDTAVSGPKISPSKELF